MADAATLRQKLVNHEAGPLPAPQLDSAGT
jgi:hypothetical protein